MRGGLVQECDGSIQSLTQFVPFHQGEKHVPYIQLHKNGTATNGRRGRKLPYLVGIFSRTRRTGKPSRSTFDNMQLRRGLKFIPFNL
jgi:hypothetical protein